MRFFPPVAVARRRSAFSLIETVVTVGLLAVLAAFVIPTVIQKVDDGDPVKVANDLITVRTGLEGWASDVRTQYPNRIRMLTDMPAATDRLIDSVSTASPGTLVGESVRAAWNGPYMAATIGAGVQDSMATGFTAFIHNHLQQYDAIANKGQHSGGTPGARFSLANTRFAAIKVTGLSLGQAQHVNRIVDGPTDFDVAPTDTLNANANINGRFRYDKSDGTRAVTAYFLTVPINR